MNTAAFQVRSLLSLLVTVTIAGCWWYAAVKKPGAGILYWLAIAQTVGVGISAAYLYGTLFHAERTFWEEVQAVQTLVGMCNAALYVVFVKWLVDRP